MSSPSKVTIPVRTSSKYAMDKQRLTIKASKSDLKRKLSTVSFEAEPIKYRKLQIESLELEIEEQRWEKTWLDAEHQERKMTDAEYRRSHRNANQRIVSLGDKLWHHSQTLRDEEEMSGRAPPLGPDTKGAFVHTLLSLYKDPNVSTKRSSQTQSALRRAAIATYESDKGAPEKDKLWCPVTCDYFNKTFMVAAHIVPRHLNPGLVDYVFGAGTSTRINTPDNCMMLHNTAESLLDNGDCVIIPADPSEQPIKTWRIRMTNNAAKNTDFGRHLTLSSHDGKILEFKNEKRPAARFLYYHFIITLLRNKRARQPGWEGFCSVDLANMKPFATTTTPGSYLRHSMLLVLARSAGATLDAEAEAEAEALGQVGRETFEEEERLAESEEMEIGRRIFVAHDTKKRGDYDDDED